MAYSRKHSLLGYRLLKYARRLLRNPERKLNYTNHMIMLDLHNGNFSKAGILENEIQSNTKLKTKQLFSLGDFHPSGETYTSDYLKILFDSRVSDLSSYLISGLSKAEEWVSLKFPGCQSDLTYFFMNGTGPSPFNAQLGDVYLQVGHYNPVSNDRELVQHAIIHELTHIYLRNQIGFRIRQSEFGIRKFFDEGLAQYCGFQSVGAYKRKLAHADACSAAIIKKDLDGLLNRLKNWMETLFNERYYPLYQASMSFIGYLESELGYDALINLFMNTGHEDDFPSLIQERTGASIQNHLSNWSNQLPDLNEITTTEFCVITSAERISATELKLDYKSKYPLYPLNDILVLDSSGTQYETRIKRSKRYEKSGDVFVICKPGIDLSITVVHDHNVQQTEIRNSV